MLLLLTEVSKIIAIMANLAFLEEAVGRSECVFRQRTNLLAVSKSSAPSGFCLLARLSES